jgi:hypothetical protein
MSVATPKQQQSLASSLDYRSCSIDDLRTFVQNRTTLTAAAIRKLNKVKLVSRLKRLDATRTFRHFMDVPPELRLDIYQRVLFIDGHGDRKNRSALLRVSRMVHSESEPVLYCVNSFCATLDDQVTLVVSETWRSKWNMRQYCRNITPRDVPHQSTSVDMLLGLRQMTISMTGTLAHTSSLLLNSSSAVPANRQLVAICFMLSSASRLKTLVISNLPSQDTTWNDKRLTELLYPVTFLHKNTTVRVEGGSLALHNALENRRQNISLNENRTLSSCGTILSRAMYILRTAHDRMDTETSYLICVRLFSILLWDYTLRAVNKTSLACLSDNLQELDLRVANAEAELADL